MSNDSPKFDDGGPAFPHPINKHAAGFQYKVVDGMSLLDHFAGQALAGDLASQSEHTGFYESESASSALASRCYRIAAAMLAERRRLMGGKEQAAQ